MYLLESSQLDAVRAFFNDKHEIIVCSASASGEPNAALMGSCRLAANGRVELEISEPDESPALTFANIKANKHVMFMRFIPGPRARDYKGLRIYAEVTELETEGPKLDAIRRAIADKHGAEKAAETRATVSCTITSIRPVLDRQQGWERSL